METRTVTLPSGLAVTYRRPSAIDQMMFFGGLRRLSRLAEADQENVATALRSKQTPEDIEDALQAQAKRLTRVCLEPEFTLDPVPPFGKRSLHDLTFEDYTALLRAVQELTDEGEAAIRPTSATAS